MLHGQILKIRVAFVLIAMLRVLEMLCVAVSCFDYFVKFCEAKKHFRPLLCQSFVTKLSLSLILATSSSKVLRVQVLRMQDQLFDINQRQYFL